MSDIKIKLKEDLATIGWQDLLAHAKRDAVIVVNPELDLVMVGEAIAKDNSSLVNNWIQKAQIAKPSTAELSQWNNNPETQFTTLIVQPFVIVQKLSQEKHQ